MARVVLCSQNLPVPPDPRVWREARTLAAAGHEVTVLCPRGEGLAARQRLEGVTIVRYPAPPERAGAAGLVLETANALLWTMLHAIRLRLAGPIDVLHAANPPDTFFLVALALRPTGTRFVFDHHDACPELLRARTGGGGWAERILRALERASFRCADLVITPNNAYRRLATGRGRVDPARVITVRTGVDAATEPEPDVGGGPRRDGPVVVGLAGVLGEHDGVEALLEAAARVLARRPGSLVVELIGDGTAAATLAARAAALGIDGAVHFTGWLEGAAFRRRLAGLDIAVSPDPPSAFNRISTMAKLIDYVANGRAVVASDTPSNRETAGDAAVYVAAPDVAALAAALDELVRDPRRRADLQRRARRRAPLLRWEPSGARLLAAYRQVLGTGPGPEPEQHLPGTGPDHPDAAVATSRTRARSASGR